MPDVSGLELVGLLHDRPDMKKVLLTFSRIEMKDRVKIAEAGIDEIITKPVDETRLKGILDRFL
jgi:DNA-binding response OmpR family regulator